MINLGKLKGYGKFILGLILILIAVGAYIESKDLQEREDKYCGGIIEALLDWDGNCDDLREYITTLEIIGILAGVFGLILVISGNNEAEKS